jgi:MFS family permease
MNNRNDMWLFWASFFTLIAAGMGFAITNDILREWGRQFGFTQSELGQITGMGLTGFGLTIIFFSFFADLVGYGKLMVVAFLLHATSVVVTLAAPYAFRTYGQEGAYWCLYIGQFSLSLANGTCEAVINPLTASLFPRNKTHWLNILHAGWPGGLVLGALVTLGLNQIGGIVWQVRWSIVLLPMLLYGLMMVGRRFPRSEAREHGVTIRQMMGVVGMLGAFVVMALIGLWLTNLVPAFRDLTGLDVPDWSGWALAGVLWIAYGFFIRFSPGYLILAFLYVLHAMVGYVELGTDRWIIDITKTVLANEDVAQMAFIWTNVLMFTLRFFAGPIVHKISPVGLLFASAVVATIGLYMLGQPFTNSTWPWLAAVTIYGLGKTFYWPTMLGVISERYPKGGALALGVSGGVGMLAAGLLGNPLIGYKQDFAATQQIEQSAPETYQRYRSPTPKAPIPGIPEIAGLDNAKIGVLADEGKQLTTDLELLRKEGRTDPNLDKLNTWWTDQGKPNAGTDKPRVNDATLHGGKTALYWTAAVPAAMAVGYLLLILIFRLMGGYKQVHLGTDAERYTGGVEGPVL